MNDIVIVQPWFTAVGHPAQSLLNTAKALRHTKGIRYLVSNASDNPDPQLDALRKIADVQSFRVNHSSLREGTLKALLKLFSQARHGQYARHIFFFDGHLVLLAAFWHIFNLYLKPKRISLIYLMGPERVLRSRFATWLVNRFLQRPEVVLYVRTEELMTAWRTAFSAIAASHIRYLPSLELPEHDPAITSPFLSSRLKFGIIGQIRHGKGLEWLVPMFKKAPDLGQLTVAGGFNNPKDAQTLSFLNSFGGYRNEYMSDETMLTVAQEQHYLLMLYDAWDARMESAVLYLAARAGRPVIAYDKGWCGRQINKFGNGILVNPKQTDIANVASLIKNLPHPDSSEYGRLLEGVASFRNAHSVENLRVQYLQELMN